MAWKFDAILGDLVFRVRPEDVTDPANFDLGSTTSSDIALDSGDRENDSSILDQGLRVFEVGG